MSTERYSGAFLNEVFSYHVFISLKPISHFEMYMYILLGASICSRKHVVFFYITAEFK